MNYRTPALTVDCLRSLIGEHHTVPALRVVVVDNDSRDGSAEQIEKAIAAEKMSDWACVIRSGRNGGFAFGNNVGLAAAVNGTTGWAPIKPELVWLLNPDAYVRPGAAQAALAFFASCPEAGIAGTGIENADGSNWLSAFHFPSWLSELDDALAFGPFTRLVSRHTGLYPPAEHSRRVDWVSGASFLVRYSVIEQLGFLDQEYFMYFEETDFCLAAARHGIQCWQVPESRVVHLQGKSSGVTGPQASAKRRPRYWFESRSRYFRKNHGSAYLHLVNMIWCLLYPLGTLQRRLRGRPRQDPPHLWWDLIRNTYLPGSTG